MTYISCYCDISGVFDLYDLALWYEGLREDHTSDTAAYQKSPIKVLTTFL